MSEDVNILANIANFDAIQNGHIGQPLGKMGQFHDQGNVQNAADEFQNDALGKTYEQGFAEGYSQAENLAQGNALLANALGQSLSDMKAEIEIGHRRVLSALLQAALPVLVKNNMLGEITDFVMSLSSCALGGQIQLRVHPEFEPKLEQIVQSISNDDDQAIFTIKTSKSLSGSAVQALWQGGGGSIDIENTIRKLLTHFEQD